MYLIAVMFVALALALIAYLIVARVRADNAPLHAAAMDEQFRTEAIQLAARILAADDNGWAIPDDIVRGAAELFVTSNHRLGK